jgi:hypothetical protein
MVKLKVMFLLLALLPLFIGLTGTYHAPEAAV